LSSQKALADIVNSGGKLLKSLIFDGSDTLSFNVGQGTTVSAQGTFTAVFNADGKTGTLTADSFSWDINEQKGSYSGDIGIW
jgi:hypothetical protein